LTSLSLAALVTALAAVITGMALLGAALLANQSMKVKVCGVSSGKFMFIPVSF
jgi:hypothetical protein